ncbi:MAG: DUF5610 domain-containing protein [Pseudomonadales bacterium]|nr:DUF5610 domain-containing protein [Pseudomonadales bacterium]
MQIPNTPNVIEPSTIKTSTTETPSSTPLPPTDEASVQPQNAAEAIAAEQDKFNQDKEIIATLSTPVDGSSDVNISAGSEAMNLLYKAAIEGINDALKPSVGENAIQKAMDKGVDVSPEATAERIVNMSTAFYEAYKEQHAGEDEEDILNGFIDTIASGIEQGFTEAKTILEGLGVLEGSIEENIQTTYELVMQGLENFKGTFSQEVVSNSSNTSSDSQSTSESISSRNEEASSLSAVSTTVENPAPGPKNIDVIV